MTNLVRCWRSIYSGSSEFKASAQSTGQRVLFGYATPLILNMTLRLCQTKALFTWREGNPPSLLEGLPTSIVFPGFVYVLGRFTLEGGSPHLLGRVTLLEGFTFYHVKGRGRVTLVRGLSFQLSDYCLIRAIYKHDFSWLC